MVARRYTRHSEGDWADLVRAGPQAAVVCSADPVAAQAARVVPAGAKIKFLGKSGSVIAGYTAKRRKPHCGIGAVRLADLTKLVKARFQGPVDTDDAVLLAEVAAAHGDAISVRRWMKRWTPNIDPTSVLDDERVTGRRWTATALGKALGLTFAERHLLGIRTIRAADVTPDQAKELLQGIKLDRERARDEKRRRDRGATVRLKGDSAAAEAAALGVSRATIMRRRAAKKRGDTRKPAHTLSLIPQGFSGVSPEIQIAPHATTPATALGNIAYFDWQAAALRAARTTVPASSLDQKIIRLARVVAARAAAHRLTMHHRSAS